MYFPTYYGVYISLVLPLLLFAIVYSLRKGLEKNNQPAVFWSTILFLLFWTVSMFYLSITGFFASSALPTGPIATGSFVLIGLMAYFFILNFKKYILSIPLPWLIAPQLFRILGGIFIFVTLNGFLPLYWGLTVGFGDFLTGIFTIPLLYSVTRKSKNWRRNVLLWSAFGLTDVVHAIIVATIMTPSPFQIFYPHPGIETTNYYPLCLIVVIARPMVVLLHLYIVFKVFTMKKI